MSWIGKRIAPLVNRLAGPRTASDPSRGRGIADAAFAALVSRASLASYLGQTYGGTRDMYSNLGYNKNPVFNDFMSKYLRQDIARAIINAPVCASWAPHPEISESEDKETAFEKDWNDLIKTKRVFNCLQRVDTLQAIGEYAVLLLGFDGESDLSQEVSGAASLLYLAPYSQQNATISTYDADPKSERFGLPQTYSINMRAVGSTAGTLTTTRAVHWSRVIHVAEDNLDDDVLGTPMLLSVLNRLEDIDKVAGGAGEMFWRGALPGYGFSIAKDASPTPQSLTELQTEIENYMHNLQRYIRLEGMDVTNLAQQVADPTGHIGVLIDLISGATRIPKRILLGSERGELSSAQDERAWQKRIAQRQQDHCEPTILRPFIDRLILHGVLSEPADGYSCIWPDQFAQGEKEQAETAALKSRALRDYVESGGETILPAEFWASRIMGFDQVTMDELEAMLAEQDKQMVADAKAVEEQDRQAAAATKEIADQNAARNSSGI